MARSRRFRAFSEHERIAITVAASAAADELDMRDDIRGRVVTACKRRGIVDPRAVQMITILARMLTKKFRVAIDESARNFGREAA